MTRLADAHGASRGAARQRSLVGVLVQHVRRPGRGDQGAVGAGREPAAAAQRSDPESGRDDQGIAQQEKDVFGQIADSRAKLAGAKTPARDRSQAANEQSAALARLLVVVENYPQLRVERAVQPADGRTRRARRTGSPSSACDTTSACRITTCRGGSSPRTSRRASSASRNIRSSTRRPRRSSVPNVNFGKAHRSNRHGRSPMRCCPSSITRWR